MDHKIGGMEKREKARHLFEVLCNRSAKARKDKILAFQKSRKMHSNEANIDKATRHIQKLSGIQYISKCIGIEEMYFDFNTFTEEQLDSIIELCTPPYKKRW